MNPQTTNALTFLTHIILAIGGVETFLATPSISNCFAMTKEYGSKRLEY